MAFVLASILAVGGAWAGESSESDAWPMIVATPAFVAKLHDKAARLAQSEIAKFNTIELTYKDTVEFHQHKKHPFNPGGGVFVKSYTEYTDYWIKDIRQTDSFLHPITFDIAYRLKFYATTGEHHSDTPGSEELAEKETEYHVRWEGEIVRNYACDATGEYVGDLPEIPERGHYFESPEAKQQRRRLSPDVPPPAPPLPLKENWVPFQSISPTQ